MSKQFLDDFVTLILTRAIARFEAEVSPGHEPANGPHLSLKAEAAKRSASQWIVKTKRSGAAEDGSTACSRAPASLPQSSITAASHAVIDLHQLGWDGNRFTISIYDRQGVLVFFKLAKDPDDTRPGPKIMTSPGGHVELYGWERVLGRPFRLIVCEGYQ